MEENNARFKVEWLPRKGKDPFLRVKNKGKDAVYSVCIDVDLMDEAGSFRLTEFEVFQAGDSNDLAIPLPEGYSDDINWQIEVEVVYYKENHIPHREKFIKTLKLNN